MRQDTFGRRGVHFWEKGEYTVENTMTGESHVQLKQFWSADWGDLKLEDAMDQHHQTSVTATLMPVFLLQFSRILLWIKKKKKIQSSQFSICLSVNTQDLSQHRLGSKPTSSLVYLQYTSLLPACTNQSPQNEVSSFPIDVQFFTLKCHNMMHPFSL